MQQIKLLKPLTVASKASLPRARPSDPAYELSTTISLTNDLGEQFFYGETTVSFEVRCHLNNDRSRINEGFKIVRKGEERWTAGKRALLINTRCSLKELPIGSLVSIHVHVLDSSKTVDALGNDELTTEGLIQETLEGLNTSVFDNCTETSVARSSKVQFIPVSSDLLEIPVLEQLPVKTERLAIRSLSGTLLYEELSGSIARHVWDAGDLVVGLSQDQLAYLLGPLDARLNILELGTGIGLVSIHLSRKIPNCRVLATDLPDAREMCEMNIDLNRSSVTFDELDWESNLATGTNWDIIITTDCTYNPAYYDALLNVLTRESSTQTRVVLVHKFREPYSESAFFTKIARDFTLDKQIWYSNGATLVHAGVYRPN